MDRASNVLHRQVCPGRAHTARSVDEPRSCRSSPLLAAAADVAGSGAAMGADVAALAAGQYWRCGADGAPPTGAEAGAPPGVGGPPAAVAAVVSEGAGAPFPVVPTLARPPAPLCFSCCSSAAPPDRAPPPTPEAVLGLPGNPAVAATAAAAAGDSSTDVGAAGGPPVGISAADRTALLGGVGACLRACKTLAPGPICAQVSTRLVR